MIRGFINTRLVYLDDEVLCIGPSLKVFNHSPTGFAWGYNGSGPAQLALAILMLQLPEERAVALHQDFKRDIIADLDMNKDFEISEIIVKDWIAKKIS